MVFVVDNNKCCLFREHFVDTTRAISEGTGEKDTKKALEYRRKEVLKGITQKKGKVQPSNPPPCFDGRPHFFPYRRKMLKIKESIG